MMPRYLDIPTIEEARKRVSKRSSYFMMMSTLFAILLLVFLFFQVEDELTGGMSGDVSNWILFTLVGYVVVLFGGKKILDLLQLKWNSLDELDADEKIGGFKVGQIREYVGQISEDMAIEGERVQVCTMDSTIPNAFGLLWRNVICLDRSWLRVLDEQELRALISHELYHLKLKRTRPMFSHPQMLRFIVFLELSIITTIIFFGDPFSFPLNIFVFIFVFQWVNTFFLIAPLKASRAEEHLCDWSALRYTGLEGAFNLMLKLGQRYELISVIQETVNKEAKKYRIPLRDYVRIQKRIDKNIERRKMSKEGVEQTVKETMRELAEERDWKEPLFTLPFSKPEIKFDRATKKHKIDWIQYDDHIRDFKLDKEEMEKFVRDIKADRKSYLFDANIDSYKDSHGTHPTIKQRVLFLWNNYRSRKVDPA